jgi:hypothetical protein
MQESAFFWMDWLCPLDLMTCTLVSKQLYVTAHCDVLWTRHRDVLLQKCPSLSPLFSMARTTQKRHRFDSIQLDTSTTSKPWARPSGIWNVFMKLSSKMWSALTRMTKKSAIYTEAYLNFVWEKHEYEMTTQHTGPYGLIVIKATKHLCYWRIITEPDGAILITMESGLANRKKIHSSIHIWNTFVRTGFCSRHFFWAI